MADYGAELIALASALSILFALRDVCDLRTSAARPDESVLWIPVIHEKCLKDMNARFLSQFRSCAGIFIQGLFGFLSLEESHKRPYG